ncbi:tRNA pseudouridine(55) synthase TruB [Alkalibacter mobilis]|uniref:tRNA pseudouridine(55) synthase TruB n=1 Tax=Alkalibacter mobilis TaxID=2787712 RepID=UPI00189D625A|nr:tRNA pseudouridine(55) synthase TruB [Alkalibacter mobilis]MBF7095794.1 tRNA pseudouridine(55) synthase TruB [Alkalibacter mobilis]
MNGILNIYKPPGITSHDVVSAVRRKLNTKRVGHTGTLDPMAEGVLPICIGQATRLSSYMLEKDKEYIAELKLGEATDTFDASGNIQYVKEVNSTESEINAVVKSFSGEIIQKPPVYSALKVKGKKLYEYAREGKHVDIEPRKVTINKIDVMGIRLPLVKILVNCSKGTYIRSLISDIGEKLDCGAHMISLIRTKSGYFQLEESIALEDFKNMDIHEISVKIIPMDFPVMNFERIDIHEHSEKYLKNGNVLYGRNLKTSVSGLKDGELVRLYCESRFYGMGEVFTEDGQKKIKPKCIFNEEI